MTWHGQINRTIWEINEAIKQSPASARHRRELLRAHFLQLFEYDKAFHVPRDDRSFLFLQDADGQIQLAHSISAGLDYPGVGPEHAYLKSTGRAEYVSATDKEALTGLQALSRLEGIIPALEPAHAIGYLLKNRKRFRRSDTLLICLSGRGDKDVEQVSKVLAL